MMMAAAATVSADSLSFREIIYLKPLIDKVNPSFQQKSSLGKIESLPKIESEPLLKEKDERESLESYINSFTEKHRPSSSTAEQQPQSSTASTATFSVATYNTLADCYIHRDLYPYCDQEFRPFKNRFEKIMKEIESLDTDVIGLQEVERNHYNHYFVPAMSKLGYEGVFMAKDLYDEGAATFWRTKRLRLRNQKFLPINSLMESECDKYKIKCGSANILTGNIALASTFEDKISKKNFTFVNTHVYWQFVRWDVQSFHVVSLLSYLKAVLPKDEPMIFTGDFNSVPGSAVYRILQHGHLTDQQVTEMMNDMPPVPYFNASGQIDYKPFIDILTPDYFKNPFGDTKSAYATVLGSQKANPNSSSVSVSNAQEQASQDEIEDVDVEPEFTNWTDTFTGTLDYIFYTSSTLKPTSVLGLPSLDQVNPQFEGCPNQVFPSDHLSLKSTFTFI